MKSLTITLSLLALATVKVNLSNSQILFRFLRAPPRICSRRWPTSPQTWTPWKGSWWACNTTPPTTPPTALLPSPASETHLTLSQASTLIANPTSETKTTDSSLNGPAMSFRENNTSTLTLWLSTPTSKIYISYHDLYFSFRSCNLDDVVFSVGKIVSSLSGLSNAAVNLIFRAFSDDYTDFNTAYAAKGNDASSDEELGRQFGIFIKKFLSVQIPETGITLDSTSSTW